MIILVWACTQCRLTQDAYRLVSTATNIQTHYIIVGTPPLHGELHGEGMKQRNHSRKPTTNKAIYIHNLGARRVSEARMGVISNLIADEESLPTEKN